MRGCFEVVAAGPAIVRRATEGWAAEGRSGAELHPIGAEAVFAAAEAGDPVARDVIEDAGRAVAWGVHLLALTYDVERIVLGGGVSHAGEPFMAPIQRELDRFRGLMDERAARVRGEVAPDEIQSPVHVRGCQFESLEERI